MKKSIVSAAIAFFALFSTVSTVSAQSSDVAFSSPVAGKRIASPNIQADKNFRKTYKNVLVKSWSRKEDGYRVRFNDRNIQYMVDYDKKGRWTNTIKIYDEKNLAKEIANMVQTTFLGYAIVQAMEIQTSKVTVYLVKIENKDFLKTIRVINGETDVFEEYRKN
jgi:hypothetical protein